MPGKLFLLMIFKCFQTFLETSTSSTSTQALFNDLTEIFNILMNGLYAIFMFFKQFVEAVSAQLDDQLREPTKSEISFFKGSSVSKKEATTVSEIFLNNFIGFLASNNPCA